MEKGTPEFEEYVRASTELSVSLSNGGFTPVRFFGVKNPRIMLVLDPAPEDLDLDASSLGLTGPEFFPEEDAIHVMDTSYVYYGTELPETELPETEPPETELPE